MPYDTYNPISWSDGTPISSDRLQQMSTNSDLIKTTTEAYSQGVLKYAESSTNSGNITDATATNIISFTGLSVGSSRWVKFTFTTPGIKIDDGDDEENQYHFRLVEGTTYGTGRIAEWNFGVPDSNDMGAKQIAGGSYTVFVDSSATGIDNKTYTIFVKRSGGTSVYKVLANATSKTQLFAEDCGSI